MPQLKSFLPSSFDPLVHPPLITLFYKVREAMLPAVAARRLFDSGAKFTSVLVVHRDPATGQVI